MLLIQMTGLSGAGKSSIASLTQHNLTNLGYKVQLLDGDECRRELFLDLGTESPEQSAKRLTDFILKNIQE